MRPINTAIGRLALLGVLVLLALMAMTGTASAHAQLDGSDPHAGDVLATAPSRVTLSFGEPVESARDAVQVFDDRLQRVDLAAVSTVPGDPDRIQVRLRPHLHKGTYTVSWHVSSADTHPVSGSFTFSVGARSQVAGRVPTAGRNDSAGLVLGGLRAIGYTGLILGPGALFVVLLLWPAGLGRVRTRRILYAGLGALALNAVGSLFLEGVWASGRPWSALWVAPSTLDTHSRRFDTLYALRCYALVLFAVLLAVTISARAKAATRKGLRRPQRPTGPRSAALGLAAILLMITWPLAGHAAAGSLTAVAVGVDLFHLAAMAVWLGGLVVLAVSVRGADLGVVLPRFSRLAFGCVVVLVVTGTYQVWRGVGTVPALFRTRFGHVLIAKLAAVVVVVALGGLARLWVRRHLLRRTPAGEPPTRSLQRGLFAELAVGAGILSVTAALVVLVPARQAYVAPFDRTLVAAGLRVAVHIDAARAGDTVLRLTTRSSDGRPLRVMSLRGSSSLPADRLGPLPLRPVNARGASIDGREDVGLSFPRSGRWVVRLTVQTSPLDATVFAVTVPVT